VSWLTQVYKANPNDATHLVVGTEETYEDTLNIRIKNNRVSISLGTTNTERHHSIAALYIARNMPITYIRDDSYSHQLCLASTFPYAYGDRSIADQLDFINACLFRGEISTELMTTLRTVTGATITTLEDRVVAMDISPPQQ